MIENLPESQLPTENPMISEMIIVKFFKDSSSIYHTIYGRFLITQN
jgi:hypothetical protein